MIKHLDNASLLDYLDQKLDQDAYTRLEEHLHSPCLLCQQKLAALRHITHLMRTDQTNTPPANMLDKAVQIFCQQRVNRPRLSILANLIFDSLRQPSLAAVRGAGAARQFLFSAEEYDIDLHIKNDDNRLLLMGQILGSAEQVQPQPQICLLRQGETLDFATADPRGCFSFEQVSPGNYQIAFQFDDMEIAVHDLEL